MDAFGSGRSVALQTLGLEKTALFGVGREVAHNGPWGLSVGLPYLVAGHYRFGDPNEGFGFNLGVDPLGLHIGSAYRAPEEKPEKKPAKGREKKSYELKDLLGDAFAAGTAGAAGGFGQHAIDQRGEAAARQMLLNRKSSRSPSEQRQIQELVDGSNRSLVGNAAGLGSHLIGGAVGSVGDHQVMTPLLSTLGAMGGSALLKRLAPQYAGPGGAAAASALGSLAGRSALRGYDALTDKE